MSLESVLHESCTSLAPVWHESCISLATVLHQSCNSLASVLHHTSKLASWLASGPGSVSLLIANPGTGAGTGAGQASVAGPSAAPPLGTPSRRSFNQGGAGPLRGFGLPLKATIISKLLAAPLQDPCKAPMQGSHKTQARLTQNSYKTHHERLIQDECTMDQS